MVSKILMLTVATVGLCSVATAAGVNGRAVAEKLVGNTAKMYDWGCTDETPSTVYHFREDGTLTVQTRQCNVPEENARTEEGRWEIRSNRFCMREMSSAENFCFGLNEVTENNYGYVFFNGVMRQAWTSISIAPGNPFNLD